MVRVRKSVAVVSSARRVDDVVRAEVVVVVICHCGGARAGVREWGVTARRPEAAAPAGHEEEQEKKREQDCADGY